MSRSAFIVREEYVGTGALTDYTFDFKITALSQIIVMVTDASFVETFRVRGDDITYLTSVDFDAEDGGGTIHLASALPSGHFLTILLADDEPLQEKEFRNKHTFTLSRLEDALDVISGQVQRLAYLAARALKISDTLVDAQPFDATIPVNSTNALVENNADKILAVGDDNASIKLGPTTASIFQAVLDAASSKAAAAASEANAVASAAAALVSENAAAASELAAAASEINAANSAAAALVSENNAAASEANILANLASKADDNAVVHLTGDEVVAGTKQFTGKSQGDVATDSTTTGADAVLPAPSKLALRLTNASLTSIGTISGGIASQHFILINKTGAAIAIKENLGAGANSILTGTGTNLTLENNASLWLYYDPTSSRWTIVGGSGAGGSAAFNAIAMPKIGNPTAIDTLDEVYNHMYSAGVTDGANLTDNGDGTIGLSSGVAFLRSSASQEAPIYSVEFAAQTPIALTDNSINYVYLDYNAGSPQFVVSTSLSAFNCMDKCIAYTIVREGTVLHYVDARGQNVDANRKHRRKILETENFKWVKGGSILSAVGTRNIAVSAGSFYYGLNKISHSAFDTSVADTFAYYYRDGLGGWTKTTGNTQINNTQYDDGTGILSTLTNNRYGVFWVYLINNTPSSLAVQFGQGDYQKLADAQASIPPSAPPTCEGVGVLLGRIIIQKSAAAFATLEIAFYDPFVSTAISHNGLVDLQGGTLNEYYHLTSAEYTMLQAIAPSVSTQTLGAADTITYTAGKYNIVKKISGTSAAVTLNATTGITNGTIDGQRCTLIGQDDSNSVTVANAGNILCNGNYELTANRVMELIWDNTASKWIEISRSH